MPLDYSTRASLLLAAGDPANKEAQAAFAEYYGDLIRSWCRRWGLQEADQNDIKQSILCRLLVMLPTFKYDPSKRFRGLLGWMIKTEIAELHRTRQRRPGGYGSGDTDVLGQLHEAPAPDDSAVEDLTQVLAGLMERGQQLREACERVQKRVKPSTWQAFWLTTYEGLPAADVAERLGMPKGTVFVYKNRMTKEIQSEIKKIQSEMEGASDCGGRGARPPGGA